MYKDIPIINFTGTDNSAVFSFNPEKSFISGRDVLTQMIVKRILTQRGSNVYDPELGTNFPSLFSTVDLEKIDSLRETFPVMIKSLQEKIKEEQRQIELTSSINIPANQRLESLNLIEAEFDEILGGWLISIEVKTATNQFTLTLP